MNKMIVGLLAVTILGPLAGCARTVPIPNISTPVAQNHTVAEVRTAILRAGNKRQWIMNDEAPGVIRGRQQSRGHVADIRISYSATGYTINYDSSSNLLASDGSIHKNYSRWVTNLDKDIQVELSAR